MPGFSNALPVDKLAWESDVQEIIFFKEPAGIYQN